MMPNRTQNQYLPNHVSPPGETLRETLEYIGMSQTELAARTELSQETIGGIIMGEAAITQEIARLLERALGIPAGFWNDRERHYREAARPNFFCGTSNSERSHSAGSG